MWVKRTVPTPPPHQCETPIRVAQFKIPTIMGRNEVAIHTEQVPDGEFGDLWQCDVCGELWRIGNACDLCDPNHPNNPRWHPGRLHGWARTAWRPATWRQRRRLKKGKL